jgi:peptidylprolyl isomerase
MTEIPEILAASPRSDWQSIPDENLLYFELPGGTVVLELAPFAAPENVAQLRALTRSRYYDNSAVERAQEDYVVQWGDPTNERSLGDVRIPTADERTFPVAPQLSFWKLDGVDSYAPRSGIINSFPVGLDRSGRRGWIIHCHGVVGAVHDDPKTTQGGTFLYAVIGHRPRELDAKIAVAGRIIQGIDLLSTLPRGQGPYGFFAEDKYVPIARARIGSDIPAAERRAFEELRAGSATFAKVLAAKRGGGQGKVPAPIDVCSIPLPVRQVR